MEQQAALGGTASTGISAMSFAVLFARDGGAVVPSMFALALLVSLAHCRRLALFPLSIFSFDRHPRVRIFGYFFLRVRE